MPEPFQYFQFSFRDVAPSSDELFRFIHSSGIEEHHPAKIFVEEILRKLENMEGISGGYQLKRDVTVSGKEGLIAVEGNELYTGKQIAGYLKDAASLAVFVCTAGPAFTNIARTMNTNGDVMEAYLLDAIGSLTVEKAMDLIQQHLADKMKAENLHISNRYSPGYCNWGLNEQKKLFSLMGGDQVGVTLTDSCLMIPEKSVSGIIGVGKGVRKYHYGCKICNNSSCVYRKITHEK